MVRVEEGIVRGISLPNGILVFRGIPYASPPVGANRWRPPLPPLPWKGERDASQCGPASPQGEDTEEYYQRVRRRLGKDTSATEMFATRSEDCLYLNIWTHKNDSDRRFPVLVWIHGGSGVSGSGSDPLFRGTELALRGLLVVTLNYRLGVFGFLAHPALSADDPARVSGNYALMDIVQALTWIHKNIAAFGGDPSRVTIAGQSAGGTLIEVLLASRHVEGLVQRAILQSTTWPEALPLRSERKGESAEKAGVQFMKSLGVRGDADAATLRLLPLKVLLQGTDQAVPSIPVVDGQFLEDDPARLWAKGNFLHVPILTGINANEFSLFIPPVPLRRADYVAWVRARYPRDLAEAILRVYPPAQDPEATRRQRLKVLRDETFGVPIIRLLRSQENRAPLWVYRFAWQPDSGSVGAFHGAELPFVFGTHKEIHWWDSTPRVVEITNLVQCFWADFVSNGDPNGSGLPEWPESSAQTPTHLIIGSKTRIQSIKHIELLKELEKVSVP
jgi:para-nitrobenzyl esterase